MSSPEPGAADGPPPVPGPAGDPGRIAGGPRRGGGDRPAGTGIAGDAPAGRRIASGPATGPNRIAGDPATGPNRIARDPAEPTAAALDAILVDGEPVPLRAGETIAACMLADGRLGWRTTRFGAAPRGVFCGIGVCFDCLVTVNGVAGVRACRRTARPGDVVATGPAEPALEVAP